MPLPAKGIMAVALAAMLPACGLVHPVDPEDAAERAVAGAALGTALGTGLGATFAINPGVGAIIGAETGATLGAATGTLAPKGEIPPEYAGFNNYDPTLNPVLANQTGAALNHQRWHRPAKDRFTLPKIDLPKILRL
jgi:hypothetical protein